MTRETESDAMGPPKYVQNTEPPGKKGRVVRCVVVISTSAPIFTAGSGARSTFASE
jgi:hypothetical protein